MNEPTPNVPTDAMPTAPAYKDRSTGLVVFGVFTILLGAICGMMVPFLLLGQMVNAKNPNVPSGSLTMLLPAFLLYGGLAVVLVWLGVGSIKARRWARALLLVLAWSWLLMGVIMMAVMVVILPKILTNISNNMPTGQPGLPPGAMAGVMVIACLVVGLIFMLLPAVWVFFYGSRHVKATCEARNPAPGWTDACPLPVLAVSLWLWLGVPMLTAMPVAYHGVIPFFGVFIHGALGGIFYLLMAAIWAWAGWRLYRLDGRAWWVVLVVMVAFFVSSMLTYLRHDPGEMYRLMGYPDAQIEQMQKTGLLAGNRMAWMSTCCMVPFLGYLLFVKRYLRTDRPTQPT